MAVFSMAGSNPALPTYPLQRSVRFRASASAYFNRTPATSGNRQIFTISFWLKRGTIGSIDLFRGNASTVNGFLAAFLTNSLYLYDINAAAGGFQIYSARVFRDPSAWYHIVIAFDTTQATDSNRVKVYINGVQENLATWTVGAGASRYPSLNANLDWNNTNQHQIGYAGNYGYFDGYFTEFNNVSGYQLDATSFGAYNSYGVWSPAKYTGTYGTNGFYLNFQDNSALTTTANVGIGKDSSGNGNYWTSNNISITAGVTYDSMLDVPTLSSNTNSNYCTLNPLAANTSTTPTQGNLYLGNNAANNFACVATMGVSSGKWYWEVKPDSGFVQIGITSLSYLPANVTLSQVGSLSKAYYGANGQKYDNGTGSAYGATFSSADLMGIALDMDAGTLTFYKNNVSQGTAFTGLTGTYFPVIGCPNTYNAGYPNFGQRPFTYTPPTGYNRLCTYNLPDSIVPVGAQYMAATKYTGNHATNAITNTVNGFSLQPDFIWIKDRSAVTAHVLFDSVRGVGGYLSTNNTTVEDTTQNYAKLNSFNSNGFTLGASTLANDISNYSGDSFVGWQWRASNASAVTNTSGSITSQVSANQTAGFSIVTYTGTGANATVGHGLNVAPKMVITKSRSLAGAQWGVYHASLSSAAYAVYLNLTNAQTSSTAWNSTAPTSSVFSIGVNADSNNNTSTYVAYCFAAVPGYSAFGSYTGNGSTDGPFVFTNFRPRWIMWKRTDTTGSWYLYDTSRSTYNASVAELYPNLSNAEANSATGIDILSNGWKIRTSGASDPQVNASGGTYIYAAFAENPFKNALAR